MAFVLSGGGNLGAAQVGMLRALLERGVQPDLIVGCSIGALNGAVLAEAPSLNGIARLERTWLTVVPRDVIPRQRLPHAVALARRGEAIHSNDGIRRLLARTLCARRFEDLDVRFECVATDVEAAAERWFADGPLFDAVLASSALPALFPPVEIDGRYYLDGGVVNDVPLQRAVDLGAKELYVMEVGSFSRRWEVPRRPLDTVRQAHAIARQHRFQKDLTSLPDDVQVHLLPHGTDPERKPIRVGDFRWSAELIEAAYEASSTYLRELDTPSAGNAPARVGPMPSC